MNYDEWLKSIHAQENKERLEAARKAWKRREEIELNPYPFLETNDGKDGKIVSS